MKKYDLHIHSMYSKCSINRPKDILKVAKKRKLDGVAITDHNCIKGARQVKKFNKDKDFEVIIGEEIRTDKGEVIGLYLEEQIKGGSLFEVLDKIRENGGISIIAHPFRLAPWMQFKYPVDRLKGKVDGLEVFNSRNSRRSNKKAEDAAKKYNFAKTGSSDAHLPFDIGRGFTLFDGDLKKAIKQRKTKFGGTTRYGLVSAGISAINKRILTPLKVKKEWK